ncbi:hypothetical protein [Wolbachia endosymbiont of Atemnus politus]|uniref:hypothetical protein n=1 Tax=Wolbachia endosymbiont of Atemnus politus TaxID=2682840 RepID=UPI001574C9C6|nr:hypothetical protein [Wolbachia endosymbiont of Atemnus politus]
MIVLRVRESRIQGEAISNIATGIGIAIPIQQRLEEYAKKTKPDSDKSEAG